MRDIRDAHLQYRALPKVMNFNDIVDSFITDGSTEPMERIVKHMVSQAVTDEEVAYLAKRCAESGQTVTFNETLQTADIASTGAPTSLSTLLCPLYLREMGLRVPSLTVPGRPAGGIDVLAQIPGYKINLERTELLACMEQCGYVHLLADATFAPRDANLFVYRQRVGAQKNPGLVIASLLAKKAAVGVHKFGLDVRVAPHGNFGDNWDEARQNAQRFCRVSKLLQIDSTCFLTDARFPYQPYIGRGESLIAVAALFSNMSNAALKLHAKMCFDMSAALSSEQKAKQPDNDRLLYHFAQNLSAQGGDVEAFRMKAETLQAGHRYFLSSSFDGFLAVRPEILRTVIVEFQKQSTSQQIQFPDPCGLILQKNVGDYVRKGDLLATVRAENSLSSIVVNKLQSAFTATATPFVSKPLEVIHHA